MTESICQGCKANTFSQAFFTLHSKYYCNTPATIILLWSSKIFLHYTGKNMEFMHSKAISALYLKKIRNHITNIQESNKVLKIDWVLFSLIILWKQWDIINTTKATLSDHSWYSVNIFTKEVRPLCFWMLCLQTQFCSTDEKTRHSFKTLKKIIIMSS